MAKACNFQMAEVRRNQFNHKSSTSKYFLCCMDANVNICCGVFFGRGGFGSIFWFEVYCKSFF